MVIMYKYHKDGTLPENGEIFVFGSNLAGIHGAGAAFVAKKLYGAVWGKGRGMVETSNGGSYAIATKDEKIETRPLEDIRKDIELFCLYTQVSSQKDTQWFVTRVGCGLAGYQDYQIAPMFKGARNCSFAEEWRPYLDEGSSTIP
jgi:hypothetical protein